MHNPHVVAKAQKELDGVLSAGQLPDFTDEESLPYITAIVKEALRWRDVTPIGEFTYLTNYDKLEDLIKLLRADSYSPSS